MGCNSHRKGILVPVCLHINTCFAWLATPLADGYVPPAIEHINQLFKRALDVVLRELLIVLVRVQQCDHDLLLPSAPYFGHRACILAAYSRHGR